jgi:hypothetical protein
LVAPSLAVAIGVVPPNGVAILVGVLAEVAADIAMLGEIMVACEVLVTVGEPIRDAVDPVIAGACSFASGRCISQTKESG